MKSIASIDSIRLPRNPLLAFILLVIAILGVHEAVGAILDNDLNILIYIALLAAASAVTIAILNDWHRGVYLLVGWIIFEDFVRKYLGNNMAVYFAKDVLTLILYLSFFRTGATKQIGKFRIPFRVPLMVYFWFCLLQMFNPGSPHIAYGILGLKVNFLYVPLLYVGYAFVRSEEHLRRFLSFCCVLILIVAGLGLVQSIIGPTFLNPSTMQEDIRELGTLYRAAPISGLLAYRPTSVFVSASRFQDFLVVSWIICLGYCGYLLLRSRRGRTLAFLTLGIVAASGLMSASRGVFMWNGGMTLVTAGGFLWGAPWRQREALRTIRAIQRTTLLIGTAVIILLTFYPKALGSRMAIYSETLMPDSPASELVARTQTYPLKQLGYAFEHERWPYGYGLGTFTLGAQYVTRIFHAPRIRGGVESGFGNLVVETGIVGLVLYVIFGLSLVFSGFGVVTKLRGSPWFPLAFAIWLYGVVLLFPMMFTGNSPYQDFVLNSFFWLFLGILFRLELFQKELQSTLAAARTTG